MFIQDGVATPAARSIEFRNDVLSVVEANIVDAIFEGIQGETMTRWDEASRFDRLEYARRRKTKEELGFFFGHTHGRSIPRSRICSDRTVSLEFSRT
jgi:hypothetical protein